MTNDDDDSFARQFAGFYHAFVNAGLSHETAVQFTNTMLFAAMLRNTSDAARWRPGD